MPAEDLDMSAVARFNTRISVLPQELYDQIRELTFAVKGDACVIDKHYKPPATLQVNAATRTQAIAAFYAHTIFQFNDIAEVVNWLTSLLPEHRQLITLLRYETRCVARPREKIGSRLRYYEEEDLLSIACAKLDFVMTQDLPSEEWLETTDVEVDLRFDGEEDVVWTSNPASYLEDVGLANIARLEAKHFDEKTKEQMRGLVAESMVMDDEIESFWSRLDARELQRDPKVSQSQAQDQRVNGTAALRRSWAYRPAACLDVLPWHMLTCTIAMLMGIP